MALRLLQRLAVIALLVGAVTPAFAADDVVLGPESLRILNARGENARDPVICSTGESALAAWTADWEGRPHVFAALLRRGRWTAALPVDESARGAASSQPAVAYSPDASPALAWIEEGETSTRVRFRMLDGVPQTVATVAGRAEAPSLTFDATGRPLVAWSEGRGTTSRVRVARRDDGADWTVFPVTFADEAYDILPTLIGGTSPALYWYALDGQDFALRAIQFDERGWRTIEAPALPTNRLPVLYDAGTPEEPGALWVEPLPGGEQVFAQDPRATHDEAVLALPRAGDDARQLDPDAADRRETPAYVWREETATGADVVLMADGTTVRVHGILHVGQPRVAPAPDGRLHVLFTSSTADGGSGDVYWAQVP